MECCGKALSPVTLALLIGGLVVGAALFIERPLMNTIRYGEPDPSCQAVLNERSCNEFADSKFYEQVLSAHTTLFSPDNPVRYFGVTWLPMMTDTANNVFEQGRLTDLPVIRHVFDVFAVGGIVLILIFLREFWRSNSHRMLIIGTVFYVAILFLDEYHSYLVYQSPAAIRARYLIPVLPLFMYFSALALSSLFASRKKLLLFGYMFTLLLFVQGGSVITYALTTPRSAYWQNRKVLQVNDSLRRTLSPFILGA